MRYLCSAFIRVVASLVASAVSLLLALSAHAAPTAPPDKFSAKERAQGFSDHLILAKPLARQRATVDAAEARENIRVRDRFARFGDLRVIALAPDESASDAVARLRATGRYEFVEPDYLMTAQIIPNDPGFPSQWGLSNTGLQLTGSTPSADIKAIPGWDILHDAPNVIVALIDNGVRPDHVDLAPNLWVNPAPTFGDVNGARFLRGNRSGDITDNTGHGTHVAGILCASGNNGLGTAGVVWRTQLMVLKNAGADGISTTSDSAACVDYAIAHGAHVINCSFGGTTFSQTFYTALRTARDAGIVVVAAAGNNGVSNDASPFYPAGYLLDNILSVGNSGPTDTFSSSSDYGATVELFAPGTAIVSADFTSPTGIVARSGTSMAAPHVAGAMVLLRAQFPNDTYRERINRLLRGTELKSALAGRAQTNGRLNLARALTSTTNRPFNDDFADRAIITGTTLTLRSNNRGATIEPGEPGHAGTDDAGASLWWLWIAPATGTVVVDTAGSDFDTTLDIFTGSTLATLVPVTSNDNYGTTVTSRVAFPVTALASYIIAVSGKTNTSGYAQLSISPAPANDHFANATPLAGESAQSTARNNSATTEPTEPRILGFAGGASLWYKWTAPRTGRFQVSAFTFDFNTLLAVYTGSSLANLALVAANDDTDLSATIQNSDSRCTVAATAGTTYYFQVDTKNPTSRGLVTVSVTDSLWQLSTDGSLVTNSVSVGPDGTLYLGTTSPDSRVYAVNPDGSLKWTYAAGASMDLATPAIGPDGMIYFGAFDGNVTALTPAGTVRWQRALGTGSTSFAPALAADGTLYTHHTNGSLYALSSADGTVKWSYNVGNVGSYYTAAIIAPDGTVYQGSVDKNLYALNPNGTLRWKFATGGDMLATPALDAAGNIYLATYSTSRVISLTPAGVQRWVYAGVTVTNGISSSPCLSSDGTTVYLGATDRKVHALDAATGEPLWTYTTGGPILASSPAVDSNGVIYIGAYDGKLYALYPGGTLKRTWDTAQYLRSSPVIFGTTLYLASNDSKLYAFDIGAYAGTGPWPQYRQNVRHLGRAAVDLPVITAAPQSVTLAANAALTLYATAIGQGALFYQWNKDGRPIPGANTPTYSVAAVGTAQSGSYTLTVSTPNGSVTSPAAAVALAAAANPGRLINLSVLTSLATPADTFTMGYVVGGAATAGAKPLIIRAAGPSLAALGVAGTLDDPKLELFAGSTKTGENDNWGGSPALTAALAAVGAFPYSGPLSKDAAATASILTRDNSVAVSAAGNGAGTGLVIAELYDATATTAFTLATPRLVNVSVRKHLGTGLTVGFVLGGGTTTKVLIRAVGPTLGAFGVPGTVADPQLTLFNSSSAKLAENDNWSAVPAQATALTAAFTTVGAFALPSTSRDAALLTTLAPGGYSVQVSGVSTTTGVALVEVYEVP